MSGIDQEFLHQNPLSAKGLTEKDVEDYTQFHSGGLIVLLRYLEGDWLVKLHDSWGSDEEVVVHRYDPNVDDPEFSETEKVWAFTDAAEAFRFFQEVTAP